MPKISELTAVSTLGSTDYVPVVQAGVTKRAPISVFAIPGDPGGGFAGVTAAQTLTNKTLAAPVVTGGSTFVGARVNEKSIVVEVQIASTVNTLLWSYTMTNETIVCLDLCLTVVRRTSVTKGVAAKRSFAFARSAAAPSSGVAYQMGTPDSAVDKILGADGSALTITSSGTAIQVYGQAPDTDPRNWSLFLRLQEGAAT